MARSDFSKYGLTSEGYNSGSSQFFIVTTDNQETLNSLNGSYTAFGKVIEGYDVIEKLQVHMQQQNQHQQQKKQQNCQLQRKKITM